MAKKKKKAPRTRAEIRTSSLLKKAQDTVVPKGGPKKKKGAKKG